MPFCPKCGKPLTCTKCSAPVPVKGTVQPCPLKKGAIWVQVNDDLGHGLAGAHVTVKGANKTSDDVGFAGFDPLDAGAYTVTLNPLDGPLASYTPPAQMTKSATVVNGQITTVIFVLKRPVNNVKPLLTLEYKVALLERNLSRHQPDTETKLYATPTYIEVGYSEDHKETKAFTKGGTLVYDAAKVELFEDKACTKAWAGGGKVTHAQLAAKQKIWLRGKGAGKFDLKLQLEDPKDPWIKILPEAKEEFGVVELKFEVHEYPAAAPFDQAAMTDENKIKRGRLLHLQSTGKDFARAKVVLKKLEASQWPGGCDAYKIVLGATNASGAVKLWDAEQGGAEVALPKEVQKSDLGADKIFWAEGASNCTALRGVRLGLGFKNGGGELKENGDWANFTVAQIESVRPADEYPNASADYTSGNYRHFINVRPKVGGMEATAEARKIKVKAKVTPAVAGIKVHFMLIPDGDNGKAANWGQDKPSTWNAIGDALKHSDRASADDMPFNGDTDNQGFAEQADLKLSQFGGDVFKVGAFFSQDPHLRKYKPGDPNLGKRKPVQSEDITVWRKLWYRMLREQNFNAPAPDAAVEAFERVKVELAAGPEITFRATDGWVPPGTFYPQYMIEPGRNASHDDVAVVGSHNKAAFFAQIAADANRPLEAKMVVCQHQWDDRDRANRYTGTLTFTLRSQSKSVEMDESVFNPPLSGALVQTGTWETKDYPAGHAKHRSGNITAANLIFETNRSNTRTVKIQLPNGTGVGLLNPILVTLKLKAAYGPYLGESAHGNLMIVYNPRDVPDYNDTVAHEIGHSINQTPRNGDQPATIPNHPQQVDHGQGNHCTDRRCIMYESGPQSQAIHRYCEVCHPYLLVEDLTLFR